MAFVRRLVDSIKGVTAEEKSIFEACLCWLVEKWHWYQKIDSKYLQSGYVRLLNAQNTGILPASEHMKYLSPIYVDVRRPYMYAYVISIHWTSEYANSKFMKCQNKLSKCFSHAKETLRAGRLRNNQSDQIFFEFAKWDWNEALACAGWWQQNVNLWNKIIFAKAVWIEFLACAGWWRNGCGKNSRRGRKTRRPRSQTQLWVLVHLLSADKKAGLETQRYVYMKLLATDTDTP